MVIQHVKIERKSVMGIVEGISVTLSQHNSGTPSFEQLWASESESAKLDIYYREAISDLERYLIKHINDSTAKFDLQTTGTDYDVYFHFSEHWPTKLAGLLQNKIQDYLVHAITAGWLSDFDGVNLAENYKATAAQDLLDIAYICQKRQFSFNGSQRLTNDTEKADNTTISADNDRHGANDTEKADNTTISADNDRHGANDTEKEHLTENITFGSRNKDDTKVSIKHDCVDWSGTHPLFEYLKK